MLQIFFTIRSERQLVERLDYDLMFRWFVGLGMDERVWNHSVFSKSRNRLMRGNIDVGLKELIFADPDRQSVQNIKLNSGHHLK